MGYVDGMGRWRYLISLGVRFAFRIVWEAGVGSKRESEWGYEKVIWWFQMGFRQA